MNRLLLFLVLLLLIPCWVMGILYEVDIRTAYSVISRIPAELLTIYGPPRAGDLGRYFYPPFTLVLFSPLSKFPFAEFKAIWLMLQTATYLLFWYFLVKLYPKVFQNNWRGLWVWIITINPLHNNFQSNNINIWLAAMLLAAEILQRQRWILGQFLAGLLVAMTVHIKVYPAFLALFYFVSGKRSLQTGLIVGLFGFTILPWFYFGVGNGMELYRGFLTNVLSYGADNSLTTITDILCLPSLLARVFHGSLSEGTIASLTKGITVTTVLVFMGAVFRFRGRKNLWELAWLLMVFLNPSTRVHYFVFLIPAFCFLAEYVSLNWSLETLLFGLGIGLVAFTMEGVVGKELNNRLELLNLPTWGMICLGLGLLLSQFRLQTKYSVFQTPPHQSV